MAAARGEGARPCVTPWIGACSTVIRPTFSSRRLRFTSVRRCCCCCRCCFPAVRYGRTVCFRVVLFYLRVGSGARAGPEGNTVVRVKLIRSIRYLPPAPGPFVGCTTRVFTGRRINRPESVADGAAAVDTDLDGNSTRSTRRAHRSPANAVDHVRSGRRPVIISMTFLSRPISPPPSPFNYCESPDRAIRPINQFPLGTGD